MIRQIKFRGKTITGEWVYGCLIQFNDDWAHIVREPKSDNPFENSSINVIPSTVGQYTELCDSEAKDVYEGDLINAGYGVGRVIFREGCFFIEWVDDKEANIEPLGWTKNNRPRTGFIIVGNVHSNPELLK